MNAQKRTKEIIGKGNLEVFLVLFGLLTKKNTNTMVRVTVMTTE